MDTRTKQQRVDDAKKIAAMIRSTDTDHRGFLFDEIADELGRGSQHYTGGLFRGMASLYNR